MIGNYLCNSEYIFNFKIKKHYKKSPAPAWFFDKSSSIFRNLKTVDMKRTVIFLLLALPLMVYAREKPSQAQEELKFGIEATAGFSTGYGLSFQVLALRLGITDNNSPILQQ